jgi:hypothetical protein
MAVKRRDAICIRTGTATLKAFGDAVYMPARGRPISGQVIARRPDTIVGFGGRAPMPRPQLWRCGASEVASPRPDDQLTDGGETFVVQGEPERPDPDRLVWTLDVRPA